MRANSCKKKYVGIVSFTLHLFFSFQVRSCQEPPQNYYNHVGKGGFVIPFLLGVNDNIYQAKASRVRTEETPAPLFSDFPLS